MSRLCFCRICDSDISHAYRPPVQKDKHGPYFQGDWHCEKCDRYEYEDDNKAAEQALMADDPSPSDE